MSRADWEGTAKLIGTTEAEIDACLQGGDQATLQENNPVRYQRFLTLQEFLKVAKTIGPLQLQYVTAKTAAQRDALGAQIDEANAQLSAIGDRLLQLQAAGPGGSA